MHWKRVDMRFSVCIYFKNIFHVFEFVFCPQLLAFLNGAGWSLLPDVTHFVYQLMNKYQLSSKDVCTWSGLSMSKLPGMHVFPLLSFYFSSFFM
jgi:hypothetical protein